MSTENRINPMKSLLVVCFILLIFSFAAPFLFTLRIGFLDFTETGQIGDTIAGTMSPFLNIIAVLLTFIAFYVQYQFNEKQREEIQEQRAQTKIDQIEQEKKSSQQELLNKTMMFENSLYNLIRLHEGNIKNIELFYQEQKSISGNNVIKVINNAVETVYNELISNEIFPDRKQAIIVSYLFVFYGRSLYQIKALEKKFGTLFLPAKGILERFEFPNSINDDIDANGYGVILSKYFRLLFQIYRYIDKADFLESSKNGRYFYSKIVRSILSMDEQILLFYNFVSPLGRAWIDNQFVFKYKIIRNIPIGSFNTYSPIKWLKSLGIEEIDYDYISEYFEFYSDDQNIV